jgi:hypothetical protein
VRHPLPMIVIAGILLVLLVLALFGVIGLSSD